MEKNNNKHSSEPVNFWYHYDQFVHAALMKRKGFTYRNFPHRLLLAAAGISGSPITLSSVTLTAPETAHNPATAPRPAVCRPAPRPGFTPKNQPVVFFLFRFFFFRNSF